MVNYKMACVSNLWTRQMQFEYKGDVLDQHIHTYDHITLVAKGSFKVTVEDKVKVFTAPQIVYVVKGKLHLIEALEDDSLAYCIHALRTGTREEDILEPSMTFEPSGNMLNPAITAIVHNENS